MAEFREEHLSGYRDEFATPAMLAEHLKRNFSVDVTEEWSLEETFRVFVNEYCG